MYPILALPAAALAFAVLMTAVPPLRPAEGTPVPITRVAAPADTPRLHCRLYFGCAPLQKASAQSAQD